MSDEVGIVSTCRLEQAAGAPMSDEVGIVSTCRLEQAAGAPAFGQAEAVTRVTPSEEARP